MRWLGLWTVVLALLVGACSDDGDEGASDAIEPATTSTTVVNERPIPDTDVSCAQASRQDDPMVLLGAFRAARLAGQGAEACLTAEGSTGYCEVEPCGEEDWLRTPGPICLYDCPDGELTDIAWYSLDSQPPTYVLRIERDVTGVGARAGSGAEAVTIGRGVSATSGDEGLVIVEATSSS